MVFTKTSCCLYRTTISAPQIISHDVADNAEGAAAEKEEEEEEEEEEEDITVPDVDASGDDNNDDIDDIDDIDGGGSVAAVIVVDDSDDIGKDGVFEDVKEEKVEKSGVDPVSAHSKVHTEALTLFSNAFSSIKSLSLSVIVTSKLLYRATVIPTIPVPPPSSSILGRLSMNL